jgi:hypothetical protein
MGSHDVRGTRAHARRGAGSSSSLSSSLILEYELFPGSHASMTHSASSARPAAKMFGSA